MRIVSDAPVILVEQERQTVWEMPMIRAQNRKIGKDGRTLPGRAARCRPDFRSLEDFGSLRAGPQRKGFQRHGRVPLATVAQNRAACCREAYLAAAACRLRSSTSSASKRCRNGLSGRNSSSSASALFNVSSLTLDVLNSFRQLREISCSVSKTHLVTGTPWTQAPGRRAEARAPIPSGASCALSIVLTPKAGQGNTERRFCPLAIPIRPR
jgi:hypothetical protein